MGVLVCLHYYDSNLSGICQKYDPEQFLATLTRLMASQGKHDQIISDNVLHFKIVKGNIEALWQYLIEDSTVHSYFGSQQIKW